MADSQSKGTTLAIPSAQAPFQVRTLDEARAMARNRFKERLERGDKIGECSCHNDEEVAAEGDGATAQVAGVRFRDSGRTYYFDASGFAVDTGDWVVVETSRGREAGRVIIAPHHIRLNMLQGDLKPLLRTLDDSDVERMNTLKRDAARAVKTFGAMIRQRKLPMKPIAAEYNFDGSEIILSYSSKDRLDLRRFTRDLSAEFGCRIELRQVGPRDEARLLGGLGRCGRTLCCSSWLPVYPEISMGMAKTQELSLNPSKVSGVCGRLLCCLSYENEQYKQVKSVMPRLGQTIETPAGQAQVVSLQVLKELVTVRLASDNTEATFTSADLGLSTPSPPVAASADESPRARATDAENASNGHDISSSGTRPASGSRRRRRRRSGGSRSTSET